MAPTREIQGFACHEKAGSLKPFSYTSRPLGDLDVEIKIDFCGICGSDIHTFDSGWGPTAYPVIAGHEIVGKVTEVGPKVSKFKVGQRVGVGAQVDACCTKGCSECSIQQEQFCPKRIFTYNDKYSDGQPSYGGYANYVRCSSNFVLAIPDKIESEVAAPLMCAGITTYSPLKAANVKGRKVGIIGVGGLGHLGLQWARAMGASEVVAISHSDRKKDDATKLGSTSMLTMSDEKAVSASAGTFDVILCTANVKGLPWGKYLSLIKTHGRFTLVAIPEEPLTFSPGLLIHKQVTMTGSLIGAPSEIEEMLAFAAQHDVKPWIQVTPLSNCDDAVKKVRKGDVRYRYVLDCRESA